VDLNSFWDGFTVKGPQARGELAYTTYGLNSYYTSRSVANNVKVVLRTEGKWNSRRKKLFADTVWVTPKLPPWVTNYTVDPTQVVVPGFNSNLDTNDTAYAGFPGDEDIDISPLAPGQYYCSVQTVPEKKLTSECVITNRLDPARTTIGVGEQVNLFLPPDMTNALWKCSDGKVYPTNDSYTVFTAPSEKGIARVSVTLNAKPIDIIDFDVLEPTGIIATLRGQPDLFTNLPAVGAGMQMNVVLQPMNVSFYWVHVMEPWAQATNMTGYFTNTTPPNHDSADGADRWHPVGFDNKITDGDFDHVSSYGWDIGQGGSYTWPIRAIWHVNMSDTAQPLSGWTDQIHTMLDDGTMIIKKFGHTVTRHPNEPTGTAK
jgi:hypothetical protein